MKSKKLTWKAIAVTIALVLLGILALKPSKTVVNVVQKKSIIQVVKEVKPSYSYLKNITVLIKGKVPIYNEITHTIKYKSAYVGTGVVIKITDKYTYILTNNHIANPKYIQFVKDESEDVQAKIIKKSNLYDMAVLRIRGKLTNKIAVKGFSLAEIGEKAYMVGHHLGIPYIYGEGAIAGRYKLLLMIQLPVMWGNSGSAVIDKNGNLVGLVFALPYTVIQGVFPVFDVAHGWAVDSIFIVSFLKSIPELSDITLTL